MRTSLDVESALFRGDTPKQEYKGIQGYRKTSDEYFGGSMNYCWQRIQKLLSAEQRRRLGWGKRFLGTTAEHTAVPGRVLGEDGKPLAQMRGSSGYRLYAETYCNGAMLRAFHTVSAVLSATTFKLLGWSHCFNGSTAEHAEVRNRLLCENGVVKQEIRGVRGYINYADTYCAGDMRQARARTAAVLNAEEFLSLDWGKSFAGNTTEYSTVRQRIFDEGGKVLAETLGVCGYRSYASRYSEGNMAQAFSMVSAVLSRKEFQELGWGKCFLGTTAEHAELRTRLYNEELELRIELRNVDGYRHYAEMYCGGLMGKAYQTVSAILDPGEFKKLGWGKCFVGTAEDHANLRARLIDEHGKMFARMQGVSGYRLYADRHYAGDMLRAYKNASAALEPEEFKSLGWGKAFSGTTAGHSLVRTQLLGEDGVALETMQGISGYRRYADAHCLGNMGKARQIASAVLNQEEFESLGWGKQFVGTTDEHADARSKFLNDDGVPLPDIRGIAGYRHYADTYCVGSMFKARLIASAVLSKKELDELGWGNSFNGSTAEHAALRYRLFAKDGSPRPEMRGIAGYQHYADTYCLGSMFKAANTVSAVLGPEEFARLGWGRQFNGSTDVFARISAEFADCAAYSMYMGLDGLKKFAVRLNCSELVKVRKWVRGVLNRSDFQSLNWDANPPKNFSVKRYQEKVCHSD